MPRPVSETVIRSGRRRRARRCARCPDSVYLTALEARLRTIWRTRAGSPRSASGHVRGRPRRAAGAGGRAGSGAGRRRSTSAGGAGRSRRPRASLAPGLGAGDVEHVAHSPLSDCAASEITSASSCSRSRQPGVDQQLGRARDARQRRLDLVAHRREEPRCSSSASLKCVTSRNVHRRPAAPSSPSGTWSKPTRRPSAHSKWMKRTGSLVRGDLAQPRDRGAPARRAGARIAPAISARVAGRSARPGARAELHQRARLLVDDRDLAVWSTMMMP